MMMVQQVKEILPRVPFDVIAADILKTKNADVTVTNLIEGIVKYEELPEEQPTTSSTSKVSIALH